MTSHYFIGIPCPASFETIRNNYVTKYHLPEVYKVIPHIEDLHITLLYLGKLPDHSLANLREKLQTISTAYSPFTLGVDGLSYFGSPSGPRVVYLTVKESDVLKSLQQKIFEEVATLLNQSFLDRFTPHITIAKKRKTTDKNFIDQEKWTPIEFEISAFILYQIHPTKSPKYEAIETFPLY